MRDTRAPELPDDLRAGVAIPAAGQGRRMGGRRKPFLELDGEPLLLHALRPFLDHPWMVGVAVAVLPDDVEETRSWLSGVDRRIRVVAGGASRSDSVAHAVDALPAELDVILVHDAARPLVTGDAIRRCAAWAAAGTGAVAGCPATDTLKEVDEAGRIVRTPDRQRIWHAQTPQAFPARVLRDALSDEALRARATDDAALVEAAGTAVFMVTGSADNMKVTRPGDLPIAELLLARRRESRGAAGAGHQPGPDRAVDRRDAPRDAGVGDRG